MAHFDEFQNNHFLHRFLYYNGHVLHHLSIPADGILHNIPNTQHNNIRIAQFISNSFDFVQYIAQPFNINYTQSIILYKP